MIEDNYTEEQQERLKQLVALIERLYEETAGFQENGDNQQHWYNRGYANGIIEQLTLLGYRDYIEQHTVPDSADIIEGQEFWAWGKAYEHGIEMGKKETGEIIEPMMKAAD